MSGVQGVMPQQAVHVSIKKSWKELKMATNPTDPAHHAVVDEGKFIGILPDNAAFSRGAAHDSTEFDVSVQVAGLCSACLFNNAGIKNSELYAGLPVIFEDDILKVTSTNQATDKKQVAIFIDYLELFPGHNDDEHIHAIIHLTPGFRDDNVRKDHP